MTMIQLIACIGMIAGLFSQILVQILYNRLMSGQRSPKFSCKHSGKPLNISHRERLIQSHFHPNHLNLFRRRIGYASVCNNFCRIFSGPSNQQKLRMLTPTSTMRKLMILFQYISSNNAPPHIRNQLDIVNQMPLCYPSVRSASEG